MRDTLPPSVPTGSVRAARTAGKKLEFARQYCSRPDPIDFSPRALSARRRSFGVSEHTKSGTGNRSATAASSSPTAPSIRSSRSTRGRLSRTSGSAPRSPSSARNSCAASRYGAVEKHRAGAISATPVCLKSAEPFYEPVVLAPARQNNRCGFERGASSAGRALRYAGGSAPARRPNPSCSDVSKLEKTLTSVFCVDTFPERRLSDVLTGRARLISNRRRYAVFDDNRAPVSSLRFS